MKSNKEIYFCSHCKKKIVNITEVLVVEEFYSRPFCTEMCIVDFHTPYIEAFDEEELELRAKLNVKEGIDYKLLKDDNDIIAALIESPDNSRITTNDLGEEFYTIIKKVNKGDLELYTLAICFYYEEVVSLVLFHTITTSRELLACYEGGNTVEEEEILNQFDIDPEIIENIELKKSQYLGELLEVRSDNDIRFEDYPKYDQYIRSTLDDPDELFEREDDDGDLILTYIKSYQDGEDSFFHIVMALKLDEDAESSEDILLPVLTFPSTDSELYKHYKRGELITGPIKN